MSVSFKMIVPDDLAEEVKEVCLRIRQIAHEKEMGAVYIEMMSDQPEVKDELVPLTASPRIRKPRPAKADVPRATRGGASQASATAASRSQVVYRPLKGADPDEASPAARRILVYLIKSKAAITAQDIQAWLARQDDTTIENVRKSVESSLWQLRNRKLIESVAV